MSLRGLDFDFAKTSGPQSNTATADGEGWKFDPHVFTTIQPAFGRMLILNGVNANSQVPLVQGVSGINSIVLPLLIAAPSAHLVPMVSWLGSGRVFGQGYRWWLRYKNSVTGDVSGLSPSTPFTINMGQETTPGADTYLGQKAIFRVASGSNDVPVSCDTIQLFRNASGTEAVKYLVQEIKINGASYVQFIDDKPDEELVIEPETAGLQINPSFDEGTLPPLAKVHLHATGRAMLYGLKRMGPYRAGTVSVTVGSSTVTRTDTTTAFDIARVGQSFRLKTYTGSSIDDVQVYRINSVTTSTLTVTPQIKPSTLLPTDGTTYTSVSYEIIDDRDGRVVYVSEPGDPTSFDLLRAFYVGSNTSEDLYHVFSLRGVTYGQTNEGIYRFVNDVSTDPAVGIAILKVASEGTVGFHSGCLTPFGWVYVHPELGVRLFDGNAPPQGYETIGTVTPSIPLGEEDETKSFQPNDQFLGRDDDAYSSYTGLTRTGFDESLMSECRTCYDPFEHLVHVFYVPNGDWSLREELVFDADVKCWRGPWTMRGATAWGNLRNSDGAEAFTFGDAYGNLAFDRRQDWDMCAAGAAAGTMTSGQGYVLVNSGASFDSTTYQQQGASIVLADSTAAQTLQTTMVVDVIDGTTLIVERPVIESAHLYTYTVGGIRWLFQSAWIDAGEPVMPKQFNSVGIRFTKADSGASTATVGLLKDGDESLANMTGESGTPYALNPYSVDEPSYRTVRLDTGSRLFAMVAYGTSTTGDPEITEVTVDLQVDGGA